MQKIDSHQHFWQYNPLKDAWITNDMAVIQRDFYPGDLQPILAAHGIDGCVAVQASQSESETEFLLELAGQNPFIKGVVGWIDLQADNLEERLLHYQQYPLLKGFRHVLQAEPGAFMLGDKFMSGIGMLQKYAFTYDVLITHNQLNHSLQLVAAFPQQPFVIDHLAKPAIKQGEIAQWEAGIRAIAAHQHVYCKVSGFCTEADWANWQAEDIKPYLDLVFDAFGAERLMFGSDWPVCMLAGGYSKTVEVLKQYLSTFPEAVQAQFWGANASKFYQLDFN